MKPASPPSAAKSMTVRSANDAEGAAADLLFDAGQEPAAQVGLVAAEGHGPAQQHAVGIDGVHQVDHADAQVGGRLEDDLQRELVARLRLVGQQLGREVLAGGEPAGERDLPARRPGPPGSA